MGIYRFLVEGVPLADVDSGDRGGTGIAPKPHVTLQYKQSPARAPERFAKTRPGGS